ncbi:MAG: hypothetical protein ACI8QS_003441 [Planctomycetota bacterium]|jgi:hypothetical protein
MDPNELIQDLCVRHGVPRAFGERLRPLLVRAQRVGPVARQRILDLVTRSFEEEGKRVRADQRNSAGTAALSREDLRVVQTVADVLHGWVPPGWLNSWGKHQTE